MEKLPQSLLKEKEQMSSNDLVKQKSQLVYCLLGVFFGVFGVHNFYLGRWKRGLVQCLLTVFGGIMMLLLAQNLFMMILFAPVLWLGILIVIMGGFVAIDLLTVKTDAHHIPLKRCIIAQYVFGLGILCYVIQLMTSIGLMIFALFPTVQKVIVQHPDKTIPVVENRDVHFVKSQQINLLYLYMSTVLNRSGMSDTFKQSAQPLPCRLIFPVPQDLTDISFGCMVQPGQYVVISDLSEDVKAKLLDALSVKGSTNDQGDVLYTIK